jgi:hypothetical protein
MGGDETHCPKGITAVATPQFSRNSVNSPVLGDTTYAETPYLLKPSIRLTRDLFAP